MLLELRIENLLLIERAELRPGPGLTAITGETGAGKTVLAQALDLLLGGRARTGIVRPGAREAYVEGVFELPPALLDQPELEELRERIVGDGDFGDPPEIVLARRVGAGGRTRAYVQGRSATAADLQGLGGRLLAFFGQHEHRRLTLASAQLDLLDAFGGPDQLDLRRELAAAHARARRLEREADELRERAGHRERDLDLLAFEIEEIEALDPGEPEKEALRSEQERLRRMDGLTAAAGGAAEAVLPESAEGGAAAMLAEAERLAEGVSGVDPELDRLAGRVSTLRLEAEDVGREMRRYAGMLEADPARLHEVEERLELYDRLERKHGGSVAAVLAHAERCRAERDRLERAEIEIERMEGALGGARDERDRLAARLTSARREAAPLLAERVRAELSALAMEGADFRVELEQRAEIGPAGAERVELLLAPNPGVPAAPVRDAASGGELSRLMLALMTVAGAGESRTIVFDEVDAGIGGQAARAVGERLRALAGGGDRSGPGRARPLAHGGDSPRQVLCLTHLPQIAALAGAHFRIEKTAAGDTTLTTVEELEGDGVVAELMRMLGAEESDGAARRHAEELLQAA